METLNGFIINSELGFVLGNKVSFQKQMLYFLSVLHLWDKAVQIMAWFSVPSYCKISLPLIVIRVLCFEKPVTVHFLAD